MTTHDWPEPVRELLAFWFGEDHTNTLANSAKWFGGGASGAAFDAEIRNRWGSHVECAVAGEYDDWKGQSRPALAYILLSDQFPRNLHRDSPLAFAQDSLALDCCLSGIQHGLHFSLTPVERWFFLMPLMHSESLAHQNRSMELFLELALIAESADPEVSAALSGALVFAAKHREVIARFGRFPHRNQVLGRASTEAEAKFLKTGRGF